MNYNDEARKDMRQAIRKDPRLAEQVIEYGPSLITLARLLREGHFA